MGQGRPYAHGRNLAFISIELLQQKFFLFQILFLSNDNLEFSNFEGCGVDVMYGGSNPAAVLLEGAVCMFEIDNLTFRYPLSDQSNLQKISLNIRKGDFVLIGGKSGSGKTTLLRHLKKELMPVGKRKGKIFYKGKPIQTLEGRKSAAEIGYLFQDPSSQLVMDTVWHEIAFGLENLGVSYEKMKRTVAEIVNYFNLQEIYDCPPQELSGGQKQMVNLAAITAMHPKVLLLDEPTAQLDSASKSKFLSMLQKLQKEFDMTIIFSSHDLEDVMEMADQCVFMEKGEIAACGTVRESVHHLTKHCGELCQTLPEILRLSQTFQIEPTFCMAEVRDKIEHCQYEIVREKKKPFQPIMKLSHLYVGYDSNMVLKNLSFQLGEGEIFSVVGANGSGKSTLLSCIAGNIKFDGQIECARKIVYLPQDPTVLFMKDCLEEDLMDMAEADPQLLEELLCMSDLEKERKTHPYDLSGGQKQMAALVKLLLVKPEILLLDEPTKGVDRIHSRRFGHFLKNLSQKGMTILMASHDLEFCAEFADRAGMMFDGKIEGIADVEEFFSDNYFYTTASAKITSQQKQRILLPERVRCL